MKTRNIFSLLAFGSALLFTSCDKEEIGGTELGEARMTGEWIVSVDAVYLDGSVEEDYFGYGDDLYALPGGGMIITYSTAANNSTEMFIDPVDFYYDFDYYAAYFGWEPYFVVRTNVNASAKTFSVENAPNMADKSYYSRYVQEEEVYDDDGNVIDTDFSQYTWSNFYRISTCPITIFDGQVTLNGATTPIGHEPADAIEFKVKFGNWNNYYGYYNEPVYDLDGEIYMTYNPNAGFSSQTEGLTFSPADGSGLSSYGDMGSEVDYFIFRGYRRTGLYYDSETGSARE